MVGSKCNKRLRDEALQWLEAKGIEYEPLTEHQIKIDAINFYPGKGTIYIDGEEGACKERGLQGLEVVLCQYGYLQRSDNAELLLQLE